MSGFDDMHARNKGRAVEHFQKAHDNIQPPKVPEPVEKAMEYDKFQPQARPKLDMMGAMATNIHRTKHVLNLKKERERVNKVNKDMEKGRGL